jgi:anti-sigma-K factor RskA
VDDNALHELTAGYALDALEAADARAYEQHLGRCQACQAELAMFSVGADALAFGAEPAEPPADLRERILAAARGEQPAVAPRLRARGIFVRRPARVLVVAAIAAVAALGLWNAALQRQVDRSHDALRAVALHGAAGSIVVGAAGQATMVLADLGPAPAAKTYEAWVLGGGTTKPAGLFAGGGKTVVVPLSRPLPAGAIVAVTIEPAGGSEQPTSRPFITSSRA